MCVTYIIHYLLSAFRDYWSIPVVGKDCTHGALVFLSPFSSVVLTIRTRAPPTIGSISNHDQFHVLHSFSSTHLAVRLSTYLICGASISARIGR